MLVLLILMILVSPVHALRPDIAVTQYVHGDWGSRSALEAVSIRCVIQTKDGYIWIATRSGLRRFDGGRFASYDRGTVPEMRVNSVTTLLEDQDGSLWIGTEGGGLLNYREGDFTAYQAGDGLIGDHITALAQDRTGGLWIATPEGLNVLKNNEFIAHRISAIRALLTDGDTLWIGTENGLSRFDGKTFSHEAGGAVTALYREENGSLLLGVRGLGLCRLKDGTISIIAEIQEDIFAIQRDRDQNTWIGSSRGLIRLQGSGLQRDSLVDAPVTSILEDREGSIWLSTDGEGLIRLKPAPFVPFTAEEGLIGDRACCVVQDAGGNMWFGTDAGVSKWKDGVFTNYPTASPVLSMTSDGQGSVWISTTGGLMKWNGSAFTAVQPELSADVILADPDGSLWIGGRNGLRRLSGGTTEFLSDGHITDLYLDRSGTLWVGTPEGLMQWKDGALQPFLIIDAITCIHQDQKGDLWVGSNNGVHNIRDGKLTTYKKAGGIPDDVVYSILEDDAGNLWMSGSRGVFRMERKRGKISYASYGDSRGIPGGECSDGNPAGFRSADGRLWFAAVRGIAAVDPNKYFTNQLAPSVKIDRVFADRTELRKFKKQEQLRLPPGTSMVEIHYSGISFLDASEVKFRYVLQGFDKFWTNAGLRRTATYTNLPPGQYRFKVLACNNDGVWTADVAAVDFEIPGGGLASIHWPSILIPALTALLGFAAGWLLFGYRRKP